jgi:hypothetical protein
MFTSFSFTRKVYQDQLEHLVDQLRANKVYKHLPAIKNPSFTTAWHASLVRVQGSKVEAYLPPEMISETWGWRRVPNSTTSHSNILHKLKTDRDT